MYIEGGKQNAEYFKVILKNLVEDHAVDGLVSNKFQQLLRRKIRIKDKDKVQNIIRKFYKNRQKFCNQLDGVTSLPKYVYVELKEEYLKEQQKLLRQYFPRF